MLEELRTFVLLGEEGSIQKLARRLPLTQPAVSRQIQRLEQGLGLALLDRRQKPPVLTPIGAEVQARGRDILNAFEDLKALGNAHEPEGVFRLGLVNGVAHTQLAETIVAIATRFPRVTMRLKSGWSTDLAEQHRLGLLEAAIILADGSRFYDAEPIGEERLIAIGASARMDKRVRAAEPRWVLSPEPCDARRTLAAKLARDGRPLIVAAEIEHVGLQMGLVREGIGLGLMPKRLFEQEQPAGIEEIDAIEGGLRLDVLMLRSPHLGSLGKIADAVEAEIHRFMTGKCS
jgi:DNA-binding transcriptional LysR family regulator